MRPRAVGASLLLVVAAAGCGHDDQPGAPGAPLAEQYVAIEVTVGGEPRRLVSGSDVVIGFEEDRIVVEAGCGQLAGRYSFERTRLVLDDVARPRADCPPALADQARWVGDFVTARPQLLVSGDELVINDGFTTLVLRDRGVAARDRPLLRTPWELDGGAERVVFEVDGTVTGADPCGVLGGGPEPLRYELDGDQLVVSGEPASTCTDDAVRPLRSVLAGPLTWSVDGAELSLTAPNGASATLRAAAA